MKNFILPRSIEAGTFSATFRCRSFFNKDVKSSGVMTCVSEYFISSIAEDYTDSSAHYWGGPQSVVPCGI